MNTQTEIKWITQELQNSNDPSIITYLKNFLLSLKSDESQNTRVSVEQYNKEIDEAVADIQQGNFTTQDDLERESQTW